MNKYNIFLVLLWLAIIVLCVSVTVLNRRVKTNEALINNLHEHVMKGDSLGISNATLLLDMFEDSQLDTNTNQDE